MYLALGMKRRLEATTALCLLLATVLAGSLFAQDLPLPAPQKNGMPLMEQSSAR